MIFFFSTQAPSGHLTSVSPSQRSQFIMKTEFQPRGVYLGGSLAAYPVFMFVLLGLKERETVYKESSLCCLHNAKWKNH